MKYIIHYRSSMENLSEEVKLNFKNNIILGLVEGLFEEVVSIDEYHNIIDQEDESLRSENEDNQTIINCLLVMSLKPEWIEDFPNKIDNIQTAFFEQIQEIPAAVTKSWENGNEMFFVVELHKEHEPYDFTDFDR